MASPPMSFPSLIVLLLLSAVITSNASLMAVDLGLSYIKVAVARPGKGLELVTNEQSKRKTPAAVAFTTDGERLFGDAAVAYAVKAPTRAVLDGRSLIGKCANESEPHPFCERQRLHVEGVADFTGEEVVSMLLAMARRQASTALGGAAIKHVAVTVPSWFDERQRIAIADAARIIGLNCLGVINANTAAALKYALDGKAKPTEAAIAAEKAKDKKKRAPKTIRQRVLFYDLGASGASASVAEFTSDVSTGLPTSVKMTAHAWEKGISGHLLDTMIIERLADAFDKQRPSSATPSRDIPRVMMRLKKESQKVREVLSANTDTYVAVSSLHDDIDLKTTVSREDFEKDASSLFSLVGGPVKVALKEANLDASDLDAVVPFGGASRTPRVQKEICDTLGIASLNKSINTDEAAVMGSVYFAASLSSTFRVRKLDFEDIYGRPISAEVEKEPKSGRFSGKGKPGFQKVELFPAVSSKMPSKKTLSMNRKKDFGIQLFLDLDKSGKTRFPERTLYGSIKVKGVADVLKKVKDASKAKTLTPRVALTFHVDRSGHIRLGTAESSVDETIIVEREIVIEEKSSKKNQTQGNNTIVMETPSENPAADSDISSERSETKSQQQGSEEKDKKKKKKKTKIEKSSQTVVYRQALTIEFEKGKGLLDMQMSGQQLDAAQKVLKSIEAADNELTERANAFNALEGYILAIRSQVRGAEEEDDIYKVSTEEDRRSLVSGFDDAEDWMYTEDAKQTGNLRKKHHELQALYAPIEARAVELSQRPEALQALTSAADLSMEKITSHRQTHVERKSDKIESFDEVIKYVQSVKAWVTETDASQAAAPLTDDPAILIKDIAKKAMELRDRVEKVLGLEPPSPLVPEASAEDEDQDSEKNDTDSTKTDETNVSDKDLDEAAKPDSKSAEVGAGTGSTLKDEL